MNLIAAVLAITAAPCSSEMPMLDADVHLVHELLDATGRGNSEAFARLCTLARPLLMGVAFRILRCRVWAEEAFQESTLKVWQNAATWVPALGSALAWLKAVVRNQSLDLLRRARCQPERTDREADSEAGNAPDPFDLCSQRQEARQVLAALCRLLPREKEALMLFYFKGCSHTEVAVLMDVPLGTVKAWLRRSLARLALML